MARKKTLVDRLYDLAVYAIVATVVSGIITGAIGYSLYREVARASSKHVHVHFNTATVKWFFAMLIVTGVCSWFINVFQQRYTREFDDQATLGVGAKFTTGSHRRRMRMARTQNRIKSRGRR